LREGSFDKNPKTNNSTKKLTTIYTAILSVSMESSPGDYEVFASVRET
jgi:hypothetical protein